MGMPQPKQNKELETIKETMKKKKSPNKKYVWKILNDPNHQRKTHTSTCANIQYWMAMVTTEEEKK